VPSFRLWRLWFAFILAFPLAFSASAQVVTLLAVTPSAAQVGTEITLSGNDFPTGSISAGNIQVTITPPSGNGSPVTLFADAITGTAPTISVKFFLPAALTVSTPESCQVTIKDSASTDAPFSTLSPISFTIDPPPTVLSASPGAVQSGSNGVNLAIVGQYTQFTSNTLVYLQQVETSPSSTTTIPEVAGSTVLTNTDGLHLTATFNIPAGDPLGAYDVIAVTGSEVATLPGGLLVDTSGPLSVIASPNTMQAGQSGTIAVTGSGTHFVQGVTVAALGDGITVVGPVSVTDATDASFAITIDPLTPLGGRTLTMETGGEFAVGSFTITPSGATLMTVGTTLPSLCASMCSGPQGSNATLQLTGSGTHWVTSGTQVSVGGGINAGNVTVLGPSSLLVNISIGPGVPVGSYPVTVTTNGEVVGMNNAFKVTAATPYLSNVSPNSGPQGQQGLSVTFTGVYTTFTTGAISANFGANITVVSVTPNSATSATAVINIDNTAFTGSRTGALTSNGTIYNFTFTVQPSAAQLTSCSPGSGYQGASLALEVTGSSTNWQQGLTFASLGAGIAVNRVVINSPTTAEVDITIPTTAGIGYTGLTMSTGGEIVSLSNVFQVLPYTPSMTLSPSSGMIPVAPTADNYVSVNFIGNFTNFDGSTIAAIDGNGVTIQGFHVLNQYNATATFQINQTAPASPALPCSNAYGGNHIVTVETPIATGAEIVYAGFCVTSTPAVLTSISPYHSGKPASDLTVTITGQYTHFEQGVTTVGFGPNITVVAGSVMVATATQLTATINIDNSAVLGWRPVFVNTVDSANFINEQLTIGFNIDPPATSSLLSVLPSSGIQGQSLQVQITGNLTQWAPYNAATGLGTTAIFGAGISVNSLKINSGASATANISIDPVNSPVGGSTVTMVTQLASGNEEIVSGPLFSVTQGDASIDHTGPACSTDGDYVAANGCQAHQLTLYQGTITPLFLVVGANTHFLQGETTLNFGSDIAVSQIQVLSPTVIECQIAIAYTATTGFRGFTAVTNDEVAPSFSDALNIMQLQGSSVNITPASGEQGTTFTMQVNGTDTHWTANDTTVSFGNNNGVNVTHISVISLTQMNLTVQVAGTAYVGPYTMTVTTTGLPVTQQTPEGTEQIVANNIFGVSAGAAIITKVTPTSGAQNGTLGITVTGQNTSFLTGVTTAYYSDSGCNPGTPAGINVSNVTASSNTSATLSIAVSATAPTGYQTLCMATQGELVSYSNAFEVLPGNPTLNQVSVTGPAPATGTSGQQGETVNVSILGQFTHWTQNTTITFGQGITVSSLNITSPSSATATLIIDGTAYIGGRTTTVTTGDEIVSGNFFSVTQSDAIITSINPTTANQGQHILMTITGNFTHWSQEITQFSVSGGGYDIKVNGVVVNSATQAVADLSILNVSGNAGLYSRTIYMSTVGENVSLQSALLITGGTPSIVSVSPDYGTIGDNNDNVLITGQFTAWDSTTQVRFDDPAITVNNVTSTLNSSTSYTAVVSIAAGAVSGLHTLTVQTGTAPNVTAQTAQYYVYSKAAPPAPYISYEYPSVALVGQTLAVNLSGAYTNWLPGTTTVSFGAGIQVNTVALQELDVTSPTTAVANITIEPGATVGPRTVTVTSGSNVLTTTFYVTVGTPEITLVSTNTAQQGEMRLLDLVGQYTTWDSTTQFQFCSGVDSVSNVQIFGPTAAQVEVTVDPLAQVGYCPVTATTGTQVVGLGGGGYFGITPSTATIISVLPNTAIQNAQGVVVNVVGLATLWTSSTQFSFGGGVSVVSQTVMDNTHAQLTLNIALYATPGEYSLTATTGGQVATRNDAFVVQPGTPLLLSLTNSSAEQQGSFSLGILGQYTAWTNANTTVTLPNGGVTGLSVNVTSGQSITVTGSVLPTAFPGCGPVVVNTTGQVPQTLTIYGFCITPGPAAITMLSPNNLGQGLGGTVQITGTNTNWAQGVTVATFGPGISVGTLTINGPTSATATITVAANATPEANNVTLTTAGEVATDLAAFTIYALTPVLLDVFPDSGTQGQKLDVCLTGAFTHFVNGNTMASFGPGIVVNSTTIAPTASCPQGDATHGDANITIQATALTNGTNRVSMITNLGGGSQEVAVWQNSSATTQYNFAIGAGGASIMSATPTTPATIHQNDPSDQIHIVGSMTHFATSGLTPNIAFCSGVTPVSQTVVDDLNINVTVSVGTYATVGNCGVTVTTGGEVASGQNLFQIMAGAPVITSINPTTGQQGQALSSVTITGLYTHFTSGALTVTINGATGTFTANNDTSATSTNFTVAATAATGAQTINVSDTTDGTLPPFNSFTINPGTPAVLSVSPNSVGPGLPVDVTITGQFTHFSSSSVVTFSGSGVSAGAIMGTPTNTSLTVPISVVNGSTAGTRTLTVTTGAEVAQLPSSASGAFTVVAGAPNILTISPNIGVPNSMVTVTITGINTTWVNGTTTAAFGPAISPGIHVNGAAAGQPGLLTVTGPTTATAVLTIDSGAPDAPTGYDVVITGTGVASNGFTVQSSTTTPPVLTFISPANQTSGVATNTPVTLTFSEPLNPATVTSANVFISQSGPWPASGIPATVAAADPSNRVFTITPTGGPLAVGTTYYVYLNSAGLPTGTPVITDQSGNKIQNYPYYSFTTGLTQDLTGPTFLTSNIPAGATNVPTNTQNVELGFNKPIDPATQAAALSVMNGAVSVPGTWTYNTTYTLAYFTPAGNTWSAGTTYTVGYTASLLGSNGYALVNPNSFSFTTSAGVDNINGNYVTWTPPDGSQGHPTTGTQPTIRFVYNKPINPLSVTPSTFYVYNTITGITAFGGTVSYTPDFKTFTLTLPGPLEPGTQYRWVLSPAYDWVGNGVPTGSVYWFTGTGLDTTAPTVTSVSPSSDVTCAGGNPCAPVNAKVLIQFSKLMDPTSLTPGAVTLTPTSPAGPAISATLSNFSFSPNFACTAPNSSGSCNFSELTFEPSSLAANTTYQIAIPDGQLADTSGNFDPFTSSFTTGASTTADTTNGSITSITPGNQAVSIATNSQIVAQLNKAVDPLTVNSSSFYVFDNTNNPNVVLPGTIAVSANQLTLTYTPKSPYEANHHICVYLSYESNFYDLAGNYFNNATECFTTGAGSDTTAPTVISVTPVNGAANIGPNNPVTVLFSKPMNPSTFSNNVAIYSGSSVYTTSYGYSNDGTMLYFNVGNMPWGATFNIVVNPAVTDLAGNPLASEFSSTFTTMPRPLTSNPTVTTFRPGSGATNVAATTPIGFFLSSPMNPATINSTTLQVSQNGTIIPGAISVAGSTNQNVTFTPTGGTFAAGSYITVFFTSGAQDINSNPLTNYQASFTIAPSLVGVAPTILSNAPCHYCTVNDANTTVELLFSKPINAASATTANFFISANNNGSSIVPGSIALLDNGRLMRFTPTSPLAASTTYYVFATSNIQDTTLLSFAGSASYQYAFYSGTGSNSAAPSVLAAAPTNGASSIGTNAGVSVTFSENVDQNTVDPSNVTLTGPSGNIPLSVAYNSSSFTMTVTPQEPLPPSAAVTLTINGITDVDGHALNPTPYTLTFNTQAAADYSPPVFVTSNITSGQTEVPVTTSVSMTFNKPIDFRSVIIQSTVYFQDVTLGYVNLPFTVTPIGSSAILFTPASQLSVNHTYRAYASGIADLNGNTSSTYIVQFTTVLAALSGGPVVTQMVPLNGTTPPVNFSPMVQFDRGVAPTSLAGVTLTQGGSPVPATAQLSAGGTVLTLVPNAILNPTTAYVFTVTGVQDSAGNTMTGSVTRSFTTGPGIELTYPSITDVTPIYNSTTGENPELFVQFSEQINPITIGSWYLYNYQAGQYVQGLGLNWSADLKSIRITYPGSLNPSSRYYFYTNSYCNLPGYCTGMSAQWFYTGTSVDNSPETVLSVNGVNPANGAAGVPTNPAIALVLSKPAAPTSVTNASVTISPAVTGGTTVSLSSDGYTLTVNRGAYLAPSTLYTISVPAGAFTDEDGNAVSVFSSTFTTGANVETTPGSISMTLPTPGSNGAALTTGITATFSNPLNPQSLNAQSFVVYWNNNSSYEIAGTVSNPTPTTLLFTPAVALPASATINVYVGYYSSITDYAGIAFSSLTGCCNSGTPPVCSVGSNACFQTASTTDNTPPAVISMSPAAGSTNVGPYAPVSLTFNKSLNYATINSANFAMYNGSSLINVNPSYSGDRRTVTLNTTLPYNATIEIAVNTSVQDYAGNNMASAYQASFTTLAAPANSAPSVIQGRPGSGAPVTTPITLFMSAPMNLSTVQAGMYVAQNGVLVPGTATLSADLRGITWTPSSNFAAGAYIEAYLTSTATDTTGNPATAYKLTFTTQASAAGAPTEVSVYPARGSYNNNTVPGNAVVEVQFDKAINPSTVTSSTFILSGGSSPGGTAVAGTFSFLNNDTLVRFTPNSPFAASNYYYVALTTGIQDMAGDAFAGDGYYFYFYTATLDTTPPGVSSVTPTNGATGIGDNAPVRLVFNKLVDTSTITSASAMLLNGATQIPFTVSFTTTNNSTQTVATLWPLAPLPDSATIGVQLTTGITDFTGAAIAGQTTTFTTMAGADFSAPVLVRQSIDNDSYMNIPTNATFTWVFSKPLDPSTVIGNPAGGNSCCFYIYNSNANPYYPPVTVHVSADGLTVTLVPASNLSPGATNDYFYAAGATDLNGNAMGSYNQRFETAAATNTTGPSIVETNPTTVLQVNPNPVPTNTAIEVIYSAPVSNTSLGAITLTTGGNPVPITAYLDNGAYTDDTVVRLLPTQLLLPDTTYTVTVTGVTDVAGNAAAGAMFSFTTGPNFQINATNFASATVTTSGGTVTIPSNAVITNVLDSPTLVVTFDHPIDYATLLHSGIQLRDVNNNLVPASTATLNFALSADQKTVTVTTSKALPTGTTFHLVVGYYNYLYDISEYGLQNNAFLDFTTQ
jgi:hypothetical protein